MARMIWFAGCVMMPNTTMRTGSDRIVMAELAECHTLMYHAEPSSARVTPPTCGVHVTEAALPPPPVTTHDEPVTCALVP